MLLVSLPFTDETCKRTSSLLGDSEKEYWEKVSVNPYQTDSKLTLAIEKLVEYGRSKAAIICLNKTLLDKKTIDNVRAVMVLLAAISSDEPYNSTDSYDIVEIIKTLEDSPDIDPDDLFKVEWNYLVLLDEFHGASHEFWRSCGCCQARGFLLMVRQSDRCRDRKARA